MHEGVEGENFFDLRPVIIGHIEAGTEAHLEDPARGEGHHPPALLHEGVDARRVFYDMGQNLVAIPGHGDSLRQPRIVNSKGERSGLRRYFKGRTSKHPPLK